MQNLSASGTANHRKLFLGTFLPLLTVTVVACTVFAKVSLKITNIYVSAETSRIAAKLASDIAERLVPATVNVENFAVTAANTDDGDTLDMVIHMMGSSIPYGRGIYYGTGASRRNGGVLYDSEGWVPDEDWNPATRGWYKDAVAANGNIAFSTPYIDADTGLLCVTISREVRGSSGAISGVVGVDILLDKLTAMVEETTPPSKGGSIVIISADGSYLTNPDGSKIMSANYFEESSIPVQISDFLTEKGSAFQSKKSYYASCRIGAAPWFVVVEGPLADFTSAIKLTVLVFELALIVFCVFCSLLNLRNFNKMRSEERSVGAHILSEVQNLVVAAKENAATSQDQSAAVKEIVATMEDNNALSENIATKIKDVSSVAGKTSGDVSIGVQHLESNVKQLREIADANQHTIDGIKNLSEKIDNIWDIVTLINSVADQAKIIAFNAELEASSAGEAGKNFHIVATEIRRLADGIIDGTKEIKERINEIQQSSDSLILASESGTEKINEGVESANSLSERFASIKNASEITAGSANDITTIIQQQAAASEQILITLRQIAAGVENFTAATGGISMASEKLRGIAGRFAG